MMLQRVGSVKTDSAAHAAARQNRYEGKRRMMLQRQINAIPGSAAASTGNEGKRRMMLQRVGSVKTDSAAHAGVNR